MNQEEVFLQKRIIDLANQSYRNNQFTFTPFLSQADQDVFYKSLSSLSGISYEMSGGVEGCDRQMVRFGNSDDLGYEEPFPIVCIQISPRLLKYAENLSHRDYLGSLMNLGIERDTMGDIQIKEKTAYLFCHEKVAEYITEHLDKVRHTNVKCDILDTFPQAVLPTLASERLIVSSVRMDLVIAKIYHLSRNDSILLFRQKKIFANGRLMENNSAVLKQGDVISVRGYGKFIFDGVSQETKKGNLNINISRYV